MYSLEIIEIDDIKYNIIGAIYNPTEDCLAMNKGMYSKIYDDFFLLKSRGGEEYLLCRKIDDADIPEKICGEKDEEIGIERIDKTDDI